MAVRLLRCRLQVAGRVVPITVRMAVGLRVQTARLALVQSYSEGHLLRRTGALLLFLVTAAVASAAVDCIGTRDGKNSSISRARQLPHPGRRSLLFQKRKRHSSSIPAAVRTEASRRRVRVEKAGRFKGSVSGRFEFQES